MVVFLRPLLLIILILLIIGGKELTSAAFSTSSLLFVSAPNINLQKNGRTLVTARLQQENKKFMAEFRNSDFWQRPNSTRRPKRVTIQQTINKTASALAWMLLVSFFFLYGNEQQAMAMDDKIVEWEKMALQMQNVPTASSQRMVLIDTGAQQIGTATLPYWEAQMSSNPLDVVSSNQKLFESVATLISTTYYDHTGGFNFSPKDFFLEYKKVFDDSAYFDKRTDTVQGLKLLVNMINDPYSKYLTRQEIKNEFSPSTNNDGFLGIGAIVSAETTASSSLVNKSSMPLCDISGLGTLLASAGECGGVDYTKNTLLKYTKNSHNVFMMMLLSPTQVGNLPVITAVVPFSPAERSGIVVGDRIASIGSQSFLGLASSDIIHKVKTSYMGAENYFGETNIVIAKPIFEEDVKQNKSDDDDANYSRRLIGYRPSHVKLTTTSLEPFEQIQRHISDNINNPASSGGNSICFWQLLTPANSIVYTANTNTDDTNTITDGRRPTSTTGTIPVRNNNNKAVGYIRLTRFSRSSSLAFVQAVQNLESLGAQSYIIDVRNNYGGVVQEAMLTASTLLRDPHSILCFTMTNRGGFVPHIAEEFVVDAKYPGYLLSSEPSSVTMDLMKKYNPQIFINYGDDSTPASQWSPPSAYASLHEQNVKRGIKSTTTAPSSRDHSSLFVLPTTTTTTISSKEKKIVVLINEGTASAAEVFVAGLRDNGRTVALVGAKTYGKGLIQHTFPTPDGGGLRLTVAEYLTPKLKHVTNVGGARFSDNEFVGGGVNPDIFCETKGIPTNPGADLCVGIALDQLD